MAEGLTELDKLKHAVQLIEEISMGRLEVCPARTQCFCIRAEPDSHIGLDVCIHARPSQEGYDVTFYAGTINSTGNLDSKGISKLMLESQQAYALLTAPEIQSYHPTHKDLEKFQAFLLHRHQHDQTMQPQM